MRKLRCRQPIDYSELPAQAAYVFAYGMPRAGFTYERLKAHRASLGRPLFAQPNIQVTSIGGGPASELVGLLQYLGDPGAEENVTSVLYTVVDHGREWQQREMNMYGRKVLQPRLTAWYGDPSRTYIYSGLRNIPLPWTDLLRELKRRIEDCTEAKFNSVLLNYYRDNNDSMAFHSDDEKELGPEPTIASLTFGDQRTFIFKHKTNSDTPNVTIPLTSGSVLLMKGKTQRFWKHAINREKRPCGPRVNLTFRRVYTRDELDALRDQEHRDRRLGL